MADVTQVEPIKPPRRCGEVRDKQGVLIGRYIYLAAGDEDLLAQFCDSWLKTYENDNRFFLTFDLETTGLDPLNGDILLCSVCWDGKNSIVFRPQGMDLTRWLEVLRTIPVANQNIKFDLKWVYHHWKVYSYVHFDTMVASQMAWAGCMEGKKFDLKNLADQILRGLKLDKTIRENFISRNANTQFTDDEIAYSASDAIITHLMIPLIKLRLANMQLMDLWEEVERPLIEILARSEYRGVLIDEEKVREMYETRTRELVRMSDALQNTFLEIPDDKIGRAHV